MTNEKIEEIIEMIDWSLKMSTSKMIPDAVHKEGLQETLEDILILLKEEKK